MIIESLLDTDFYKLTQGQVALHQFPTVEVEYEFKCRNEANWTPKIAYEIYEEVCGGFCNLKFMEDELQYLSDTRLFKQTYLDFLRLYQPNANHINIELEHNELKITVKGPWYQTIYFEVPVLAIVNEVYFREHNTEENLQTGRKRLQRKIEYANAIGFPFADFGTRRRFSREWHREVVDTIVNHDLSWNMLNFIGTSNIWLAKKYDVTPIGTMAHEFFQVCQASDVPLIDFQKKVLQAWADEYRGELGIALSDIIGFEAFLKDFDLYFAKLYDGLRHDSGDPEWWAEKAIAHYKKLGIDPLTKKLVFSDGLDFEKAGRLYSKFSTKAQVSFGIGTYITNSLGPTPLQIVMKIVECNKQPVAKISDSPGKGMCKDLEYVRYLRKVFGLG